ncbi:MAG: S49 family peptidase [Desulfobulbaceae bacterium]|nr:S49 family peptidase [Desulfobulbaceae bacterium]
MSLPHIVSAIVNTPLLIAPAKLAAIMEVLNNRAGLGFPTELLGPVTPDMRAAVLEPKREAAQTAGEKIGIVDMIGSLVSRNAGFSDASGLRSYRTMQREIEQLLADDEIGGIIIDADTFGGTAAGVDRFARFIRSATEQKPIYAVVDLNCYSAGIYIAAACSRVILTDAVSAGVGSIGCIAIWRGQAKKDAADGYDYEVFHFGAKKADYNPHAGLDERMRKEIQNSVDACGMQFAEAVAEFRGLDVKAVLAMEAGAFTGQAAIDAGLADEIATLGEAVALLTDDIQRRTYNPKPGSVPGQQTTGGDDMAMTTMERMAALLKNEDGPQALAELGYVKPEEAADTGQKVDTREAEDIYEAGRIAGMKQALDVAQVCELGGQGSDVCAKLIGQGADAEKARTTVQELRAVAAEKSMTRSTISTAAGDGKHPLVAACEAIGAKK